MERAVEGDLTLAYTLLLSDLESHKLEVVLVPQRIRTNEGGCIRVAVNRPPKWFSELCNRHASSRGYRRGFDSRVRRANVLSLLRQLAAGRTVRSKYLPELAIIARKREEPF